MWSIWLARLERLCVCTRVRAIANQLFSEETISVLLFIFSMLFFSSCVFKAVIYRQFTFIVYNFKLIRSLFICFLILVESFHICTISVAQCSFMPHFTIKKRYTIECWLAKHDECNRQENKNHIRTHALTLLRNTLINSISAEDKEDL